MRGGRYHKPFGVAQGKRFGVFGGTFDPVHLGHLALLKAARRALRLEKIFVVLSYQNPLKKEPVASVAHRYRMLKLAVGRFPYLRLSRYEIRKRRKVYTYETLRYLRRRLGGRSELYFLMGGDLMPQIRKWRRWRDYARLTVIAVTGRANYPKDTAPSLGPGRVVSFRMSSFPLSSSGIRRRVARGLSVRGLLPPAIERYIRRHRLYREGEI